MGAGNKFYTVFCVLFLVCFASFAVAAGNSLPIYAEISNPVFNESTGVLNFDVVLIDKAGYFHTHPELGIYLLKMPSDKLSEGVVFSGAIYIDSFKFSASDVLPNQGVRENVSYPIPKTIDFGKYFISLDILDSNSGSVLGGASYLDPIELKGTGGWIPMLTGYFKKSGVIYPPLFGPTVTSEEVFLDFNVKENPVLLSALGNKNVFATIEVKKINSNEIVLQQKNILLNNLYSAGNDFIELSLGKSSSLAPYPYNIIVSLTDSTGEKLSPDFYARWLVVGGQLQARITDVQIQKAIYAAGEPINWSVQISYDAFSSDLDKTILVRIEGLTNNNEKVIFEKSALIDINVDYPTKVFSFSGSVAESNLSLKSVKVSLIKASSGVVLDSKFIDLSGYLTTQLGGCANCGTNQVAGINSESIYLVSLLIILALVILMLFVIRSRRKRGLAKNKRGGYS